MNAADMNMNVNTNCSIANQLNSELGMAIKAVALLVSWMASLNTNACKVSSHIQQIHMAWIIMVIYAVVATMLEVFVVFTSFMHPS